MKVLKELRKSKRITQDKLSDIIGVSRSTISMWEIDASEPDKETIKLLADYFQVSTDYLLGRTDDPNPPALTIPEALRNVKIAFHRGEFEDLTQSEIDALAQIADTLKKQRKL